ncbi:MAG: hypothetical protein Q7S30_05230 [Candidatus Omnitrophota bacterium]|nr:hypothetical protein [Candidatus Omnitrophota bacterium]
MKYKTSIEITADAANKDEAMEIVGDYLSGNIASGIGMKYATKPIRFYDNSAAKTIAVVLLMTIVFFSGVKVKPQQNFSMNMCQMAAVTPPLKTSEANKNDMSFKQAWQDKQTSEALNFIKQ